MFDVIFLFGVLKVDHPLDIPEVVEQLLKIEQSLERRKRIGKRHGVIFS
jgi:hypothetical protein